jgi:hypothetical protein
MNIFHLSSNLTECAQFHVDRWTPKLALEAAQCLSNQHDLAIAPYRRSHINHPISKWIAESSGNYLYTCQYAKAICQEYTYRYGKIGKVEPIIDWLASNIPSHIPEGNFANPPRCFGSYQDLIPVTDCYITDYRNYVNIAKKHLFKWTKRDKPAWVV